MNAKKLLAALLPVAMLSLLPAADARAEEAWDWTVAPYLWGSSIKTDLNEEVAPFSSETYFSDIVSKIDMAFQMHVEGQGDRFGVFGDATYLSLSDSGSRTLFDSDASMQTTLLEAGGVWNVEPERYEGLDLLFGVRYAKVDLDAELDPTNPVLPTVGLGFEETFTDALLGVRYTARLSDKWTLISRVDGSFGQTDGTWNASMMAGYRMSKGSLMFGYRHMDLELGGSDRSLDVTMSGPVVAFAFGL